MSFSWTYLTRRFWMQNYRDYAAVGLITSWGVGKILQSTQREADNSWVNQRVYINDESDISYRNTTNKTDGAIKREHAMRYAEKIKKLRAEREREMALDAYNYLNKKELQL